MTFPQYAKTTDPAVIEAIRRNAQGVKDFHERACDFAIAQGVEKGTYYPGSFGGSHAIRAVGGEEKPTTGRWKRGYGGYGWLPFKSNPLAAELDAIEFREAPVPGLPSTVDGPYNQNGSHVIATPSPFVRDGAAYVGFSFIPVAPRYRTSTAEPEDGGWEEIKGSEYLAAMEAENEDRQAEQSTNREAA